jgi:hypothetical protein
MAGLDPAIHVLLAQNAAWRLPQGLYQKSRKQPHAKNASTRRNVDGLVAHPVEDPE